MSVRGTGERLQLAQRGFNEKGWRILRARYWTIVVAAGAAGWATIDHIFGTPEVARPISVGFVVAGCAGTAVGTAPWTLFEAALLLGRAGAAEVRRWWALVPLGAAAFFAAVGSGLLGLVLPPGPGVLGVLGAVFGVSAVCSLMVSVLWLASLPRARGPLVHEVLFGITLFRTDPATLLLILGGGLAVVCYWLFMVFWAWGFFFLVLPAIAHGPVPAHPLPARHVPPTLLGVGILALAAGGLGLWPWLGVRAALMRLGCLAEPGTAQRPAGSAGRAITITCQVACGVAGAASVGLYCAAVPAVLEAWFLWLAVAPAYLATGCAGLFWLAFIAVPQQRGRDTRERGAGSRCGNGG